MNHLKFPPGFFPCENATRPRRPAWPSHVCVIACVVAATITLNPQTGQLWSDSASPVLVAVNQVFSPSSAMIDQPPVSNDLTPTSSPMIAVVLSGVVPDETVDELTRAEKLAEWGDTPEVSELQPITRPSGWRRAEGATSYRYDAETNTDQPAD